MRNSAKAIVFRDDEVLLVRNRDTGGDFYLLPGGGQEFGETLTDAAIRETAEETGLLISPLRLVLVREYIGANSEFALEDCDVHQVELMFLAELVGEAADTERLGDEMQVGVEWLPVGGLGRVRIYPSALARLLPELSAGRLPEPLYIGDTN
jgi:ADP-ribose pyrophosphatase YjhB (NUDIX family)